jgi:hypothetical protein
MSKGFNTEIQKIEEHGTWRTVADAARTTINKEAGDKEPSDQWKKRMLLAEHSPIRLIDFVWKWIKIPYWVTTHFVRHKFGIDHWVRTERTDRVGDDRAEIAQGAEIEHMAKANVQALINMGRKRLCAQASPETRHAFKKLKNAIGQKDAVVESVLVPECIYRGFCPEYEPCGYTETIDYQIALTQYRLGAKSQWRVE